MTKHQKKVRQVFDDLKTSHEVFRSSKTRETIDRLEFTVRQASQWIEHGALEDDERKALKVMLDEAEEELDGKGKS